MILFFKTKEKEKEKKLEKDIIFISRHMHAFM
jgi:hypothetical protein